MFPVFYLKNNFKRMGFKAEELGINVFIFSVQGEIDFYKFKLKRNKIKDLQPFC